MWGFVFKRLQNPQSCTQYSNTFFKMCRNCHHGIIPGLRLQSLSDHFLSSSYLQNVATLCTLQGSGGYFSIWLIFTFSCLYFVFSPQTSLRNGHSHSGKWSYSMFIVQYAKYMPITDIYTLDITIK